MNKKDYELFAKASARISDENIRDYVTSFLMDIFKQDNENFDKHKFRNYIFDELVLIHGK